jgi:hypothetical protein
MFIALALIALVFFLSSCAGTVQPTPILPVDTEGTVQAAVSQKLTEGAPTPDIDATVNARLTEVAAGTPAQTAVPTQLPSDQNADNQPSWWNDLLRVLGEFLTKLSEAAVWLWDNAGKLGTIVQLCCCVLPVLIIGLGLLARLFGQE